MRGVNMQSAWMRPRFGAAVGLMVCGLVLAACGSSSSNSGSPQASQAAQTTSGSCSASGPVLWSSASVDATSDGGKWPGCPLTLAANNKAPTVPSESLSFAQGPYNDHSYGSIGIAKGWFDDVGVTVQPKPEGKIYVDVTQEGPALIAGALQIGTMASTVWLGAMDQSTAYKQFTYVDAFTGHAFLGNPAEHFHPVTYYLNQGLSWSAAVTKAMAQIKGKSYAYSVETSQRPFQEYVLGVAGMTLSDFKGYVLTDPKIVELATSGKVDVASPTAGPLVTELLQQGWTPIVDIQDILKYGPQAGAESSLLSSGWAASNSWLAANHATGLRLASVAYRILDYKAAHELAAADIYIPFLNSIAGTHFAPSAAVYLDHDVDPFFTFEEQAKFFADKSSPYYWTKDADSAIAADVKAGTLKPGHNANEVILAATTWRELNSLKILSGGIIKRVQGQIGAHGTPNAKSYLAKAQAFYAGRDYYDAAAFANAAKLWLS